MPLAAPLKPVMLALALGLTLAGCQSAEERAEEYYQNGLALIAEGDIDRAMVELRNVFQVDGSHREARHTMANLLLTERNNREGAYSQYLRLVEQYPDDLEARLILAELAFSIGNWDEVERHGAKVETLAPDNPRSQAITVARAYRTAALEDDGPAREAAALRVAELAEDLPDNVVLRNLRIDDNIRNGNQDAALADMDWLVEQDPGNPLYWQQRLRLLAQMNDMEKIEDQLTRMVTQFPEDDSHKQALIRFHLSRGNLDAAEAFLRQLVAEADAENTGARVDLIRFLEQMRSPEAARAETEAAIAEAANPVPFRAIRAGLNFQAGDTEAAVAELEDVIAGAAEPSEEIRGIKVTLARILLTMGNEVGARARIEEVLAEDPSQPEALKMRAAWLIEGDDVDGAVAALRSALDTRPDDAQAMTMMAQAHTRAGRPELAREFMALAVEASGSAPAETIRYARILIDDERHRAAEDILLPALRLAPGNVELLVTLGQLYLAMEDLGRADQVVRALNEVDSEPAALAAGALEAELINRRNGPEQAMAYLEDIATGADASLASQVALVRARISTGDLEGALEMARALQAAAPDNEQLRAMVAATEAVNGNLDAAEESYRALLETNPERPGVWLELSRLYARKGDQANARRLVEDGLAVAPEDGNLLWARASFMERDGNIDGAIEIYETLYERNSGAVVVANNLASLLSTHRTDPESLERAWTIARRFSESENPALQDTFGWIAHRRGDSERAVPYLEGAAAGLPADALVQYHLGMAYLAVGRSADALAQFQKAVEVAGPTDTRPQIADAQAQIEALEAAVQE